MCLPLNSFFNHHLKKALSVLDTDLCHMQLLVFVFKDSTCCIHTPKQNSPALLLQVRSEPGSSDGNGSQWHGSVSTTDFQDTYFLRRIAAPSVLLLEQSK